MDLWGFQDFQTKTSVKTYQRVPFVHVPWGFQYHFKTPSSVAMIFWWWSGTQEQGLNAEKKDGRWNRWNMRIWAMLVDCWLLVGWVNSGLLSSELKWMVALRMDDGRGSCCQVMLTNHVPSYIEVQYKHSAWASVNRCSRHVSEWRRATTGLVNETGNR